MKQSDAIFSSKNDEWETPQAIFDELDKEFHFTLDPCSTHKNHKCPQYFTKEEDGLSQKWGGVVFCNPPYSQVSKWVAKCHEESKTDGITIVLLIPARTDTRYFHDYIYQRTEIRFIKGRLHYEIDGEGKNSSPFPSMVVIFRGAKAKV